MSLRLAYGNVFIGLLVICLEVSALIISNAKHYPDVVSSGIWGGCYLLMYSFFLQMKNIGPKKMVRVLAMYAFAVGVTLIGIHFWSINSYLSIIEKCDSLQFYNIPTCNRLAIDSLMIACGILTCILNSLVFIMSSSFALKKLV